MENKKNYVLFLVAASAILIVCIGLYLIFGGLLKNIKNNVPEQKNYVTNNVTIVTDTNINKNCINGCRENIVLKDGIQSFIDAGEQYLKIGDKDVLTLSGADYIYQVSVYNDIIITLQNTSIIIYDLDGNEVHRIDSFTDESGKLFVPYLRYSDELNFNLTENGTIYFVGTKHLQGAANTYIDDNQNSIDLCDSNSNISDDEIVSGVFEMSYLGNNSFGDIKYVSTKSVVSDIKTCS